MSAGRIIAYLVAALFFVFGALVILGAFSPSSNSPIGWLIIGVILVGIAFVLIWFAGRLGKRAAEETTIVQKIDLSGDIQLEKLTCRNCGGALTADNVKMVAGAPVVNCPYCGTSYQLAEQPKW
jgi:type VI protein secretion system component VasK